MPGNWAINTGGIQGAYRGYTGGKPMPSHHKAIYWAYTRHRLRSTKPHQGHTKATPRPHQSHTKATPKPHQSHTKARVFIPFPVYPGGLGEIRLRTVLGN